MTTKIKHITSIVFIAIPAFVLIWGGIMKIIGGEPEIVVQFLTKAGYDHYFFAIGVTSLMIAALLIYPKTTKIGFLLASCYFAGALSLEISGGQPIVSSAFIAILWIGMFLRDKNMFLASANTDIK